MFALSSLWEGLPDVLLEAAAVGLPIVSFDCKSGPQEILAPGGPEKYGVLVPVGDEVLLAKAIHDVLVDENLQKRLIENGKKRAHDFDIKSVMEQWNFLYENRMD